MGAAPLIANRAEIQFWESFDLIDNADGSVSFRSHANDKLVTTSLSDDAATAYRLVAGATTLGQSGRFDLIRQ